MNVEDLHEKSRLYRVECWEPPPENNATKAWGRHWHIGVVCFSAVEAIEIVREKHPRYRIDAVNQVGTVHHVLHPPQEPKHGEH